MLVRLTKDAPPGHFQDQLTIVTDDQMRTIPLAVQGHVISPLTVSPASLFLGELKPGESVNKQLVVRGKQPFKVVGIKCHDKGFAFKTPGDAKEPLHFIPVTFTAKKTGKVTETIEIETDLGAVTTCVASGTVRQSAGVPTPDS
jgi:hypothetical protein